MTGRECQAADRATCRVHGFLPSNATVTPVSKTEFQKFITPSTQPALNSRRIKALEVIRDYGDQLEIRNEGANATTRPYVNLKDMVHGSIAKGNCWAMTKEIVERVDKSAFDDAEWIEEINIETSWGMGHTALFVGTKDGGYVVDYTARQFDESLPFPFIASPDEWKNRLGDIHGFPFKLVQD